MRTEINITNTAFITTADTKDCVELTEIPEEDSDISVQFLIYQDRVELIGKYLTKGKDKDFKIIMSSGNINYIRAIQSKY